MRTSAKKNGFEKTEKTAVIKVDGYILNRVIYEKNGLQYIRINGFFNYLVDYDLLMIDYTKNFR